MQQISNLENNLTHEELNDLRLFSTGDHKVSLKIASVVTGLMSKYEMNFDDVVKIIKDFRKEEGSPFYERKASS